VRSGAALVTGASRGIGRAIAVQLARDCPLVFVHWANDRAAAEDVVATIEAEGGAAVAVQADLGDPRGPAQLIEAVRAELGRPDAPASGLRVLVSNAGMNPLATIEQVSAEQIDAIMALNVRAPLLLVQAALPLLAQGGRIVFVGSGGTRFATTRSVAYSGSKGAVDVISRTLAAYLGPRGITVNVVAPGVIDTDMNAHWLREDGTAQRWVAEMSPFGRVGQPDDVASIVRFVASEHSGWMTGGWLDATGGARL